MGFELADIFKNPGKYGAPTFEQFLVDRERYTARKDHLLAAADDGSKLEGLKQRLGKTYWEIDGYDMDTPEQIERYCRDEGLNPGTDLKFMPYLKEGVSGKIDIVNKFERKVPKGLGDAAQEVPGSV